MRTDLRGEIRDMRLEMDRRFDRLDGEMWRNFRWLLGVMLGGFVGTFGVMAHGFHWL